MTSQLEDPPILDPHVDQSLALVDIGQGNRRRRTSKQPPDMGQKRKPIDDVHTKAGKAKAKAKSKKKAKGPKVARRCEEESESGGEDEEDEKVKGCLAICDENGRGNAIDDQHDDDKGMGDTNDDDDDKGKRDSNNDIDQGGGKADPVDDDDDREGDEKDDVKKAAPKAKGKAKGKGKSKAQGREPLRDQSKSKKFNELFDELPGELQDYWRRLSRSERTEFVNSGVARSEIGRLSLDTAVMFKLKSKREETQKGKSKMDGYIYEDMGLNH